MRNTLLVIVVVLVLAGLASSQGFITTTYASNNGLSTAGAMNMFVLKVLNPAGLRITSLDINTSTAVSSTVNIAVYTIPTNYVGKETTPSAWKLVSKGSGISAGTDKPTGVDVQDFVLAAGQYGIAIHYLDCGVKYTGTGSGPPTQKYSNSDLGLLLGKSTSGFFTGSIFSPRVWNGTIYYTPAVTAMIAGTGTGARGTTYNFSLLSASEPKLNYGMGSSFGNGPIPLDTRKLGLSVDDLLLVSTSGLLPSVFANYSGILDTSGRASASLVIPNIAALKGLKIYTAFVTLKASSPSGISSISNTTDFTIL